MKKIFTLIAVAAMFAVSCQNDITPEKGDTNNPVEGKLTATIVRNQTKVTYTETPGMYLQPAWEIGDKIIGFDDAGKTYTLTVASVSAETATLSGSVPDGALHLIYKSGAKASDISSKTLAIDYTAQAGDKTMPAVMLADGTVKNGACDFAFTNAGAISGITVTDADGTLSKPVFIAVPAGATIKKICADGYVYEPASPRTVAGGEYLYINKGRTFSYQTYTCQVRYLDASNIEIAGSKTIFDCRCGETISDLAIDIAGYKLQGDSVITRTIWEDNTTIEIHYALEFTHQWTYTVRYLNVSAGGVPIAEDKTVDCEEGENIYEKAIDIPGYKCYDPSTINETIVDDGQVFIFLYSPYAIG